MADGISIFDVIKRGGYEASLITTFNATLPFYEEVVLRKLVGAGCRHNVVLMDRRQCAAAWESEALRPRLAGYGYTLLPVGVSGAFHPKVCLLVGPKKATVLIGSHNLTLSGFGYNREITNWIEINDTKDVDGVSTLSAVWKCVREWIELERDRAPESLLESALATANFIGPLIASAKEQHSTAVVVLAQSPGTLSLFNQMAGRIQAAPFRIAVVGAFFDKDQAFISRLKAQWPSSEIVVGIDPETVQLPGTPDIEVARYVDVRAIWNGAGSYLHAKAIYFESSNIGNDVFICGSANPSRPAWMSDASGGNVEAVLLRSGPDARNISVATTINRLFDLPAMGSEELSSITSRSKASVDTELVQAAPLLSGVADATLGRIHISCGKLQLHPTTAVLFGPNLELLENISDISMLGDSFVLQPSVDLNAIRSCELRRDGECLARAMIGHPAILANNSRSSKQYQLRSALGALGSSDGDISNLIRTVERVIFADNTSLEVEVAMRQHHEVRAKQSSVAGPETLAVSVSDMSQSKKKLRLLKSGDLAYLLDVMLRRLSEGLETKTIETDKAGRTEEEQIGQDDDVPDTGDSVESLPATTLPDRKIAELVVHRARTLTRRMIRQLALASKDDSRKASAVMQLIAVLALVRELRHLDKQKRWKSTGIALVDQKDLRTLLDESVKYLFGGKEPLIAVLDDAGDELSDESIQLRVLLAWLAWDVGDELTEQIRRIYDATELKDKLRANALFLKLMPAIAADESATADLRDSILRTTKPSPSTTIRAIEWMERHHAYGKAWHFGLRESHDLRVGGYCRLGTRPEYIYVVFELQDGFVGFWNFDRVKQFEARKVTAVEPLGSAMA